MLNKYLFDFNEFKQDFKTFVLGINTPNILFIEWQFIFDLFNQTNKNDWLNPLEATHEWYMTRDVKLYKSYYYCGT